MSSLSPPGDLLRFFYPSGAPLEPRTTAFSSTTPRALNTGSLSPAAPATGTTGTDGSVTFTIAAPTMKTQFAMVFAGDSTYRKSHSNVISLKK